MIRVATRKLLLFVVLIPLLNALGFAYATSFAPTQVREQFEFMQTRDDPPSFTTAYPAYVREVIGGSFGAIEVVPLTTIVAEPLRNSAVLLSIGLVCTIVFGPMLGVAAISPRTGRIRSGAQAFLTVGSTVPGFFLGSVLVVSMLYLSRWDIYRGEGTLVPVQGFGFDSHLILPLITLAARPILYVGYLTAGLLENELQQDYVRVARSKGLSWRAQLWHHALPNINASVVTAIGQSVRMLAGGLILVEALFDWRGVGRMLLNVLALNEAGIPNSYFLNPPLLALLVVIFGALLLLADLLASLIATASDPRLRSSDAPTAATA